MEIKEEQKSIDMWGPSDVIGSYIEIFCAWSSSGSSHFIYWISSHLFRPAAAKERGEKIQ
jgi:hypothetical protein